VRSRFDESLASPCGNLPMARSLTNGRTPRVWFTSVDSHRTELTGRIDHTTSLHQMHAQSSGKHLADNETVSTHGAKHFSCAHVRVLVVDEHGNPGHWTILENG
jgi:hypothetical protein